MKKIVLFSLLVGTVSTQAQLRTATIAGNMDGLRNARKEMEMRTESSILEKLEAARLEDERNRREQFESLNFSVYQDPTPVVSQTTYVAPPTAVPTTTDIEILPVSEAETY